MMDPIQEKTVLECANKLGEAFEGCLILVCHKRVGDEGAMTMSHYMRGNDYAAIGMAHTFIELQQSDKTGRSVKDALNE